MSLAEIQIREDCPDCENGVVYSREWHEFYADESVQSEAKALRAATNYEAAADVELTWFRERGYMRTMGGERGGLPFEALPPEEEPCLECEGTGKRTRWVDVREFSGMLWLREALAEAERTRT